MRALRNIDWPEALLFDCDGVLVETERVGHRVAFNEAFRRKGARGHGWGSWLPVWGAAPARQQWSALKGGMLRWVMASNAFRSRGYARIFRMRTL